MEKKYLYIGIIFTAILGLFIGFGLYFGGLFSNTPPDNEAEEEILLISGSGIKINFNMTMSELRSDNYTQVVNKTYHFMNSVGAEFDLTFSGVSLWSILELNDLLNWTPAELTFQFIASDSYHSPTPLNLSLAQSFPDLVIIAYEEDGSPLIESGPLRSVVNQSLLSYGQYASQYSIQQLAEIIISY
jgi:hypothetical protein